MQSITTLNLNLQYPNYATTMHAVQNDKLTRKVIATLYDGDNEWTPPQGALGTVRFYKPDGTAGFYDTVEDTSTAVTWTGNTVTVILAEQMLSCAGVVLCQLQWYTSNAERLTTFNFKIDVEGSPVDDETLMSTDYFNVMTQRIADIMNAVVHPPQIALSGNWLLWDTETGAYADSGVHAGGVNISSVTKRSGSGAAGTTDVYQCNLSTGAVAGTFSVYNGADGEGISSVTKKSGTGAAGTTDVYECKRDDNVVVGEFTVYNGADGEKGDTGTAGASMTGITKISGTGAGGSTDVYQVELSNGGTGGTFSVYNGNDGQGSPGAALPLMDGTASAGSASAFSREDHVHPHDNTKVDVVAGKSLTSNDFTDALKDKLDGITAYTGIPVMDGNGSAGTSTQFARGDHRHPSDLTKVDVVAGKQLSTNDFTDALKSKLDGIAAYTGSPAMDGTASSGSASQFARGDHVHPKDITKQDKNVYFTNTSVAASRFSTNSTYSGFTYRATIPLSGVTSSMYAEVVFAPAEAMSGNYAPICETYNGGVYIWSKVNTAITIPTIVVQK